MYYLERTLKDQLERELGPTFKIEIILSNCLDFDVDDPLPPHQVWVRGPNASVQVSHGSVSHSKLLFDRVVKNNNEGEEFKIFRGDVDSNPQQSYHLGVDDAMALSFEQLVKTLKEWC